MSFGDVFGLDLEFDCVLHLDRFNLLFLALSFLGFELSHQLERFQDLWIVVGCIKRFSRSGRYFLGLSGLLAAVKSLFELKVGSVKLFDEVSLVVRVPSAMVVLDCMLHTDIKKGILAYLVQLHQLVKKLSELSVAGVFLDLEHGFFYNDFFVEIRG